MSCLFSWANTQGWHFKGQIGLVRTDLYIWLGNFRLGKTADLLTDTIAI